MKKLFTSIKLLHIAILSLVSITPLFVSPQKASAVECDGVLTSEDCLISDVGPKITGNYQMAIGAAGMYPDQSTDTLSLTIPSCTVGAPTIVRANLYWTFRDTDSAYWDETVDIQRNAESPLTTNSDRRYKTAPTIGGNPIYSSYVSDITSDGVVQAGTNTYTMSNLNTSATPSGTIALWGFGIQAIYECPEYTTVTIQQKEGQDMHWYGFGDSWSVDRSELICETFTASISSRTIDLQMFLPGSADTALRDADIWYKTGTGTSPTPTDYDLLTDVTTPANGGQVLDRLVFVGEPELEAYENSITLPAGDEYLCIQLDSSFNVGEHPDDPAVSGASMFAGAGWFSYEPAVTVTNTLSIGNLVWNDTNNDGLFNNSEAGICNVALQLYSDTNADGLYNSAVEGTTPLATTTTSCGGSAGIYTFSNLLAGNYLVVIPSSAFSTGQALHNFASSSGTNNSTSGIYEPAADPDNDVNNDDNGSFIGTDTVYSKAVTLSLGGEPTSDGDTDSDTNYSIDFGFYQSACLGNYVWNDANSNGVQDSGESGVQNVKATLYLASNDTVITTQMTNSSGAYLFCNLNAETYYVVFSELPDTYKFTQQNSANDDATDSDADTTTGRTADYTLAAGASELTVDAGITTSTTSAIGATAPNTGVQTLITSPWGVLLSSVAVGATLVGYRKFNL